MIEYKSVPGGFDPPAPGSLHAWTAKEKEVVQATLDRRAFSLDGAEFPQGGYLYIDGDGQQKAKTEADFTAKYGNVR